jgi:integrase/recombinase XerC
MVFASSDDVIRLLAQIDLRDPMGVRDHCMLVLACHTGLRVAELCGLDVRDVVADGRVRESLYVRPEIAKGSRARRLPLNSAAREAIARQLDFLRRRGFSAQPEAPLFVAKSHRRLTTRAVQYVVAELRERARARSCGRSPTGRTTACATPWASWWRWSASTGWAARRARPTTTA